VRFTVADEEFRQSVRDWLEASLAGAGWTCLGWPAEHGAAMLGQQVGFRRELTDLAQLARRTGAADDPVIRDRLARAWIGLQVIRAYALDTLTGNDESRASVMKVLWSQWHRDLGELAMTVAGTGALAAGSAESDCWQRLFLFSRADTIYGGSDEIQHDIIATRVLGLPR
jgi:alkylation response protein AidB-like acyl-CoA dehydrogenase